LHEGGFRVKREAGGTLTFTRVDGRVIPRCGYRVEDFTDDDVGGGDDENPSREGFRNARVQQPAWEVRESRSTYLAVANSA
jgi:hypothetical protein